MPKRRLGVRQNVVNLHGTRLKLEFHFSRHDPTKKKENEVYPEAL